MFTSLAILSSTSVLGGSESLPAAYTLRRAVWVALLQGGPHFQPTALWSFNFSLSNEYSFQNGMITKKITLHNCFWIGTIYTRMVRFGIGGRGFFFGIYGALK